VARWRDAIKTLLDRRGGRTVLGAAASAWFSVKRRDPCLIRWRLGAWTHRSHGAVIPHRVLGGAPSPEAFTRGARNTFLHAYEPRAGDVVLDVGAGVGHQTLLFAGLVGSSGRVLAVEAHPGTYEWLVRLCTLNDLANVVPIQCAAWEADGELEISDLDHYVENTVIAAAGGGITVPARRLDGLASELGITQVDLLAMNIEGAERAALRGMGRLLDDTRHVCIACHDYLAEDRHSDEWRTRAFVTDFLIEHGFTITSRDDADKPWTREYVYGVNRRRR
jgi:FkbM family methyltransferase